MSKLGPVWVGLLPPSSNKIYVTREDGKGRTLSAVARTFKVKAMQAIQKEGRVGLLKMQSNVPYGLHVAIFFDRVEIKKSKTGDRYAKMDISNRLKLIEDTVADAIGIDDRHNFRVTVEKHCDPQNTGLYITLEELSEKEVGLTKGEYDGLRQGKPDRAGNTSSARRLLGGSPRHRQRGSN